MITNLVLCFPEIYLLTKLRAETLVERIKDGREQLPTIYFHFTSDFYKRIQRNIDPDSLSLPEDTAIVNNSFTNDRYNATTLIESNAKEEFYLLFETDDEYVFFKRKTRLNNISFEVFRIDKTLLSFVTIKPPL
jgi:hypothetical protein